MTRLVGEKFEIRNQVGGVVPLMQIADAGQRLVKQHGFDQVTTAMLNVVLEHAKWTCNTPGYHMGDACAHHWMVSILCMLIVDLQTMHVVRVLTRICLSTGIRGAASIVGHIRSLQGDTPKRPEGASSTSSVHIVCG